MNKRKGQGYYPTLNGRSYDKSKVECYICCKMDHYAWECYRATNDTKEEATLVADNQEIEKSTCC